MLYRITVLPQKRNINAAAGENLLQVLHRSGLVADAPCGGEGRCGKCKVFIDGKETLACQTPIHRDMTLTLPDVATSQILTQTLVPLETVSASQEGCLLAFDIGTTTVVGYLLDGKTGEDLALSSAKNPQTAFGADVITRIRFAVQGQMRALTRSIRSCLEALTEELCQKAGIQPSHIRTVSVVGNPAMQQFLFHMPVDNLARVPFAPVLTQLTTLPARVFLPLLENAQLLVVPNIAGFVGADTVACVLTAGMDTTEEISLLVDIGTNGEMILGNKHRLIACSAAAGPALEGAGIMFGMRGQEGAIDHVWLEAGQLKYSVIGGGKAVGICGSGLIDAVAASLDMGWLNGRGKILTHDKLIHITEELFLTQEDIRQVQLTKGAIAAGIELMAAHMGIALQNIQTVWLAGAFGTYMNPTAACRIGLLPMGLADKIDVMGNAAGSGAKILACSRDAQARSQVIASQTEALELSLLSDFQRCFAKNMRF